MLTTPLWFNLFLPPLNRFSNVGRWANMGIKTLVDVTVGGRVATFVQIRDKHQVLPHL